MTVLDVDLQTVREHMASSSLAALIAQLEAYEVPPGGRSGPAYLELYYAIVRILRPTSVVETGVGYGYSSAAILQALRDNGGGRLHSIDLPTFRPGSDAHTGAAVPSDLRSSWDLRLGPDRRVLPALVDELDLIDVFFYDSDKLYGGMLNSWGLVWPKLRSGGLLVADDVHLHSAFFDFAAARTLTPRIVAKPRERSVYRSPLIFYQGLLVKP